LIFIHEWAYSSLIIVFYHRELAFQINEVFEALGASIGLKCCCIVGGIDMMTQVRAGSTPTRLAASSLLGLDVMMPDCAVIMDRQ